MFRPIDRIILKKKVLCYNNVSFGPVLEFFQGNSIYKLVVLILAEQRMPKSYELREVPVVSDPIPFNNAISVSSYQAYFSMPLLSEIEEKELAEDFAINQSVASAHKLVLSHMRFVVKIARNYLGYGLALSELVQEGSVGLMKAVKKFDPGVGVRLVSFAVYWIKSEIHEFVIKNWRTVKIATTKSQRKLFFNMRRLQQQFTNLTLSEQHEKVAAELEVSVDEVESMHNRMSSYDVELDKPVDQSAACTNTLKDSLPDNGASPEIRVIEENHEQVMSARLALSLNVLSAREKEVISARYFSLHKKTLKDLAEDLKISLERVRQIEKAALKKLRTTLEA